MPVFSAAVLNDCPGRMNLSADNVALCGFQPNFTADSLAAARPSLVRSLRPVLPPAKR